MTKLTGVNTLAWCRQDEESSQLCDLNPQGDVPWDDKDFRYLLVTAAGLASVLLYFYFRDNGREISWKDFVRNYISRGVVSSAESQRARGGKRTL